MAIHDLVYELLTIVHEPAQTRASVNCKKQSILPLFLLACVLPCLGLQRGLMR